MRPSWRRPRLDLDMTRLVTAVALGLIIGALAAVVFGAGPWSSERATARGPVPAGPALVARCHAAARARA